MTSTYMLSPLVTAMYVRVKEYLHMDNFHMYTHCLWFVRLCETYMVAIVPVLINCNHHRSFITCLVLGYGYLLWSVFPLLLGSELSMIRALRPASAPPDLELPTVTEKVERSGLYTCLC